MKPPVSAAAAAVRDGIALPEITPPGAEKFLIPPPVDFGRTGPLFSAISLLVFAAASVIATLRAWERIC